MVFVFFKQKTAYEMRISDWSSDVCSSDLYEGFGKEGKGSITTKSGVLDKQPYGFGTRFEGQPGTNPEELIAAAHAACFTMALSFGLARAGYSGDTLETSAAEIGRAHV